MARLIKITRTITAQNVFSDALRVANKRFSISVYGINGDTVTLQRKEIGAPSTEWRDVEEYTANAEKNVDSVGAWDWRLGVKSGDYGSGTVKVVLQTTPYSSVL